MANLPKIKQEVPPKGVIELLVIGDWVVDENWVLAKHRSSLSTMEGKAHLRAIGNVSSRVMTFCGAGRVARFLYWMNRIQNSTEQEGGDVWSPVDRRKELRFSIFGIGTWAEEDESKLYRMFDPLYPDGINPFTLTRVKPRYVPYKHLEGLCLRNLAQAYKACAKDTDRRDIGTTRVYRLYNLQAETPGGLVLDRRIDFELRYLASKNEEGKQEGRKYEDTTLISILKDFHAAPIDPVALGIATWTSNAYKQLDSLRDRLQIEALPQSLGIAEAFEQIKTTVSNLERSDREPSLPQPPVGRRAFRYAVVKDLGKGTMTTQLLDALHSEGLINEGTQWFVSSKQLHPPYLERLAERSDYGYIRFLFLPPMAIAQMEHEGLRNNFIHKWFVSGQEPTKEGLDRLEEFWKKYSRRPPRRGGVRRSPLLILAMPKGLTILGIEDLEPDQRVGYRQPKAILQEIDEELTGRASMFFAALTAHLVREDKSANPDPPNSKPNPNPEDRFKAKGEERSEMIEIALKASFDLVRGNINALKNFGSEPSLDYREEISYDPSFKRYRRNAGQNQRVTPLDQSVISRPWADTKDLWEQSGRGSGIIQVTKHPPRYRLDLWRSMGELDDYIETVEARRKEIARLILTLRDFLRDRPRNSFSAMLIANPGSGKSYLVSKLAATLGIPHRSFNVTQLITRASINACFDEIANAQAHNRDRVHMVFFDEINASVGNGNVYDLFLTVLEDGTYRRDGQLFKLDPCVWLFAGTTELDGTSEEAFKRKEADFKSRLTVDAVRVGERGEDTDERRALILQGALQLQLQHTDVKTISAEVLKAFFCLDPENTNSRRIRQLAGRFRDIQYGEVRAKNLPDDLKDALRKHGAAWDIEFRWLFQKGETDLDQILVEIKRQPDKGDYEDFLIPKGST